MGETSEGNGIDPETAPRIIERNLKTSKGKMVVDEAGETSGCGDKIHEEAPESIPRLPLPPPPPPPSDQLNAIWGRQPDFLHPLSVSEEFDDEFSSYESDEEQENFAMSRNIQKKLQSLDNALVVHEWKPKIQMVPFIPFIAGKQKNHKYYEPRMVSIGPYRHMNPAIGTANVTENMKPKLAVLFIREHGLDSYVLYSKIRSKIKALRDCYKGGIVFNDDDLAWIFVVDGCAILHYIHCAVKKNTTSFIELKIKVDCLIFMQQDLFLLRNQLPFQVLELLMSCTGRENDIKESIEKFIFDSIKAPGEKQEQLEYRNCQNGTPVHLLDLLRTRLLQSVKENQVPRSIFQQLIKNVVEFIKAPSEKLQDLMECIGKVLENSSLLLTQDLHNFHSIEELNASGIRLRPSNTGRLTDITFKLGTLKLPPIIVDDSTRSKFLNLIAYEMCPDFINDFGVSSYIVFLKALIQRPQDVKELRDKHILYNALGSDEEVVKLFNEMGTDIVSNPEKYLIVKRDIQKRCNNKGIIWIAPFNHRYFQSPWSLLAFLAAMIILALTVVTTVYAILEYHK